MAKKQFKPVKVNAMSTEQSSPTVFGEEVEITVESPTEEMVTEEVVEATAVEQAPVISAPVVETVSAPTLTPVVEVVKSEYSDNLTQLLSLCKQTGNAPVVNYIEELLDYAKKMAPSQTMPTETGAINQANLYNTLISIIDHSGKDFRIAFSTMLCIFNEYKDAAFGGAYVLRFMESVPLNTNKRKAFIKMVNLFSMTADHKTRKAALKHVDFKRELVEPLSEESRMRIVSFYNA